jgi:hypothetical protein
VRRIGVDHTLSVGGPYKGVTGAGQDATSAASDSRQVDGTARHTRTESGGGAPGRYSELPYGVRAAKEVVFKDCQGTSQ